MVCYRELTRSNKEGIAMESNLSCCNDAEIIIGAPLVNCFGALL